VEREEAFALVTIADIPRGAFVTVVATNHLIVVGVGASPERLTWVHDAIVSRADVVVVAILDLFALLATLVLGLVELATRWRTHIVGARIAVIARIVPLVLAPIDRIAGVDGACVVVFALLLDRNTAKTSVATLVGHAARFEARQSTLRRKNTLLCVHVAGVHGARVVVLAIRVILTLRDEIIVAVPGHTAGVLGPLVPIIAVRVLGAGDTTRFDHIVFGLRDAPPSFGALYTLVRTHSEGTQINGADITIITVVILLALLDLVGVAGLGVRVVTRHRVGLDGDVSVGLVAVRRDIIPVDATLSICLRTCVGTERHLDHRIGGTRAGHETRAQNHH